MFKTVLAHLTGSDSDRSVLATALSLVRPFGGHIECLRVAPDPAALVAQALPFDTAMGMTSLLADMLDTIEQQSSEGTKRARATVNEFCKTADVAYAETPPGTGGVTAAWRENKAADEWDYLTEAARFYDLTVLSGGRERAGRPPAELLGNVIIGSGRPVVLAPEKPREASIKTVAIAWKDSAESARALTAAMPLLAKAERIEILGASESDSEVSQCLDCSESVLQQLRWHGMNVNGHFVVPAGRSIPNAILETAGGLNADLLVMGGMATAGSGSLPSAGSRSGFSKASIFRSSCFTESSAQRSEIMMWWYGSPVYGMFGHGIWWVWHFAAFILVWIVLNVLGVIALQRFVRPRFHEKDDPSRLDPSLPAITILESRYARGEIGREEFMEKHRDLVATGS